MYTYIDYNKDNKFMQDTLCDLKNGKEIDWSGRKLKGSPISDSFSRQGIYNKAMRVERCGTFLEFKKLHDDSLKLNKANFCKVRLCPMCAWRRSLKVFGQVSKVMNYLSSNFDYRYIFITFTVKNVSGDALSFEMDKLFGAFNLLTKRKEFKNLSEGWFRCLEVTHNWRRNDYHPHFHMVIAVDKNYFKNVNTYLSQEKWAKLWQSCLGVEYEPLVDVRAVRKTSGSGTFSKGVAEVAKYAVKDSDYVKKDDNGEVCVEPTDEAIGVLDGALANRRLIAFGGKFKEVHKLLNLDDPIDGDLIHTDDDEMRDDLDYILVRYNWNVGVGNYIKIN